MYVCGSRTATRGPPGPGAALGQQAVELLLRRREVPAARERVGDLEADVVRRPGVLRARVAEPDDEPVDRRDETSREPRPGRTRSRTAATPAGVGLLALAGAVDSASPSPSAPSARLAFLALADELGLGLDLGLLDLEARQRDRGDDGLGVVEDRHALRAR